MKKKHLNILLIILVLGIWGMLIFKYTKRFTKQPNVVHQNNLSLNSMIKVEKKSFELTTLKRDPFLNVISIKKKKTKTKKSTTNKKTKKIKNFVWPKIDYLGYIKSNNSNNQTLAILKVNGKIKNTKESSYFNENIYIRKIYKDSIQLEVNNQIKTVKK